MIAKVASKKFELDKIMRRRASAENGGETDDYRFLPIAEDAEYYTEAPSKPKPLGVSFDLGNLQPPVSGSSSSTGMPIRQGIVNEKREVLSRHPDNFVIGDETLIERRFESSDVMETVLRGVQLITGTMSSDTTRVGRSTTPKYQKATSRNPVRNSTARGDSGSRNTGAERYNAGAQAAVGERSQSSHHANQQAEMENCMLRGRHQSPRK